MLLVSNESELLSNKNTFWNEQEIEPVILFQTCDADIAWLEKISLLNNDWLIEAVFWFSQAIYENCLPPTVSSKILKPYFAIKNS